MKELHVHCSFNYLFITGLSQEKLLDELKRRKKVEIDPHTGKIFAYVYTSKDARFDTVEKAFDLFQWPDSASNEESSQDSKSAIVKMFFHAFMHENALNPLVFPSLRQFEVETVAMVANMLNGDGNCVGTVTSGGTESLLMAVKTYRDRARSLFPSIKHPEIVGHSIKQTVCMHILHQCTSLILSL